MVFVNIIQDKLFSHNICQQILNTTRGMIGVARVQTWCCCTLVTLLSRDARFKCHYNMRSGLLVTLFGHEDTHKSVTTCDNIDSLRREKHDSCRLRTASRTDVTSSIHGEVFRKRRKSELERFADIYSPILELQPNISTTQSTYEGVQFREHNES